MCLRVFQLANKPQYLLRKPKHLSELSHARYLDSNHCHFLPTSTLYQLFWFLLHKQDQFLTLTAD